MSSHNSASTTTSTAHTLPTPRTAQTRSMTKLAQNRSRHLELYIQQQERAAASGSGSGSGGSASGTGGKGVGRGVFGGKVGRGGRGVLLDSLKNVGGVAVGGDTMNEGKKEVVGVGLGSTSIHPGRKGMNLVNARPSGSLLHSRTPTTVIAPTRNPSTTSQARQTNTSRPSNNDDNNDDDDDDEESEDELLLTPRKRPIHQSGSINGKAGWQRAGAMGVGMTSSGASTGTGLKSGLWKSTLPSSSSSSSTPPAPTRSQSHPPRPKAGPSSSNPAAGPVKRKRPSNGPSTPRTNPTPDVGPTRLTTPTRPNGMSSINPSERIGGVGGGGQVEPYGEVPNTVTPERRHKEKKRRISDSPTKVSSKGARELLGGKGQGVGEGMEVDGDCDQVVGEDEMDIRMDLPRSGEIVTGEEGAMVVEPRNSFPFESRSSTAPTTTIPRPAPPQALPRPTFSSSGSFAANNTTSSFPLRKQSFPSGLGPGGPSSSSSSTAPRRTVPALSNRTEITASSDETLLPRPTRREGLGSDVKGSLYGLSAALAKLQVKASVPPPSGLGGSSVGEKRRMGGFAMPTASSAAKSLSTSGPAVPAPTTTPSDGPAKTNHGLKRSSTMNGGAKRSSLTHIASGMNATSIDAPTRQIVRATSTAPESTLSRSFTTTTHFQTLIESDVGSGCLKGVVAYVDVRTAEGDDAGSVFIEMLRTCGAKVLAKPSESCTHIVYKSGKSSTVAWHRRQEDPKPFMVGISWVTRCKEAGKHLDEEVYKIDPEQMEIFKKRRRSMEPKQLQALLVAGKAEAQQGDRSMQPRRLSGQ